MTQAYLNLLTELIYLINENCVLRQRSIPVFIIYTLLVIMPDFKWMGNYFKTSAIPH